ncbi:phage portal protein [Clostridium beijerinckii]|uniref:phage portal protein n=1 Tax=Clostridium beijerinckii TaxID=1520 RepID=UPI001494580D|nr:phage portal protein [Clostridium beijerinckii]NOW03224.1 SPP1 family phage portal protein [Clostridium beijerinckii]NYC03634.1 SPP1 family phage portal protein [Clostridium beijerinckii]
MLFDKDLINKLKTEYTSSLGIYNPAWNYYLGKTDVGIIYNKNYANTSKEPRVYQHNYIRQFIDEETSYQVGLPITYTSNSNNVECIKDINFYFNNISSTLDINLAKTNNIFGLVYEFSYVDSITKEFKVKRLSPLEAIAYCDVNGTVQLFMYCYTKELDNTKTKYWEVVDDKFIYHCDENLNELASESKTPHFFGYVPVGIAYFENRIEDTLYKILKNPQDIYNLLVSDWSNEIGDIRQAYLLLLNAALEKEQFGEIKESGIIQLIGDKANANFITKNVSPEFYSSYREVLKQDIYSLAQHIDNQTQIQSNTSGTMLSTRINVLRIKIISNNQSLKNCIKMRLRCLFKYLSVVENKNYDFRDININFQLNLPRNNYEVAQIISYVKDIVPNSILMEQFDFISNGQVAFDMKLEENKQIADNETSGMTNLDKIGVEDETK